MTTDIETWVEVVEERREGLERLADADLQTSPFASALLEAYDAGELEGMSGDGGVNGDGAENRSGKHEWRLGGG